ncbi:hypothetical protein B0H14DRAFT_3498234 [Mycena olivaceomarginata]|nr:hypothetical protein B0H14DRAFT_3498234 [Mycena olivaceomarginata]
MYTAGAGNVHLSGDGQLYIIPMKSGNTWNSGRIESITLQSCTSGEAMVFQAEIWVPNFTGSPAHGAGWLRCGERVSDRLSDKNSGTLHFANRDGGHNGAFSGQDLRGRNSDWMQQKLTWYLDGTEYYLVTGAQIGGFTQWTELVYNPYFVILNMAAGETIQATRLCPLLAASLRR